MTSRYAVYWAPPADSTLHRLGSQWLGRDAGEGTLLPQPLVSPLSIERVAALTADARGYAFHATLKPPLRLRPDYAGEDFHTAVAQAAQSIAPFTAPPLKVGRIGGFLALVPDGDQSGWRDLGDHFVTALDPLRQPPDELELARRRGNGLTPSQDVNLLRWGYPYLFADWRFHMTLTASLTSPEAERMEAAALAHFSRIERLPVEVTEVCVFEQAQPGAPFLITARHPLRG